MDINGLTKKEVEERIAAGELNSVESQVSRTYKDILVKNVCTTFNLILFTLGAVFIVIGEYLNALATVGIITLNIIIATFQEARAKRRLDRIALLLRPRVRIMRDGAEKDADQSEIVKDDIIHLTAGDQALVDGELLFIRSLEMDESLLTGESKTIRKHDGDTVLSGSFCVTGEGYYRVTAFGKDSFASQMLLSARKFENKKSPLQKETSAVTKLLMAIALVYLAVALLYNFLNTSEDIGATVKNTAIIAAAIMDIVPIALFLLIVIAYMVAAVRMADSGVLLQRSNAVESMNHVNTVCMDKTGTITTNKLAFSEIVPMTDCVEKYIRAFTASTGSVNRTIEAIRKEFGDQEGLELIEEIQFSSERKFSAVKIKDNGSPMTIYLGALSVFKDKLLNGYDEMHQKAQEFSMKGMRTVVIAKGIDDEFFVNDEPVIHELTPIALIAIKDEIRPDCRDTIGVFLENKMDLKVISGDDPETVDAIFSLADIPGDRKIISGEEFAILEGQERIDAILETNIFGRMKPNDKEEIIQTLKDNGRYVAMVGDGVNDVKALKSAQVGVALQSGSGAARGVADIVLVDDNFAALPKALVEGRRTVSGMRDILKLYLTRNFVLTLLIPIILLISNGATPVTPTAAAFYAFVSVSIAAFLMVIWAKPTTETGPILPGVLKFAIPSMLVLVFFAVMMYITFFLATEEGWIDIPYTADELMNLNWNRDVIGTAGEINARNSMLLFLTVAGVLQILFVAPPNKFLSPTGKAYGDLKPAILVLLLLLLIAVAYGQPLFLELMGMASLGDYRILVYAMAGLWFITARYILRRGKLNRMTKFTEHLYNKTLDRESE